MKFNEHRKLVAAFSTAPFYIFVRVLEASAEQSPMDPVEWAMRHRDVEADLRERASHFGGLQTDTVVIDGPAAGRICAWARDNAVELTVLGRSGESNGSFAGLGGTVRRAAGVVALGLAALPWAAQADWQLDPARSHVEATITEFVVVSAIIRSGAARSNWSGSSAPLATLSRRRCSAAALAGLAPVAPDAGVSMSRSVFTTADASAISSGIIAAACVGSIASRSSDGISLTTASTSAGLPVTAIARRDERRLSCTGSATMLA